MLNPCVSCFKSKLGCSRTFPCENCVSGRHECEPSEKEYVTRAKKVYDSLRNGEYYHNDYAKYQIYLEATVFDCKGVLQRIEVQDIFKRIAGDMVDVGMRTIPDMTIPSLPDNILNFLGECDIAKVEWMDHGRYKVSTSPKYAENFIDGEDILKIARRHRIPPKIVDTSGFAQYDMAYRVWSESLALPDIPISYTGASFWRSDNIVCYGTIRVLSTILNPNAMITVTRMSRGSKYQF